MIKITKVDVSGFDTAIRGMRNAYQSWDKSDSGTVTKAWGDKPGAVEFRVGKADKELMLKLAKAGDDHGKFMRYITVTCDILAPLYWWKEFDTYKVGTVANSTSTMHSIAKKKITKDDFSMEHLMEKHDGFDGVGALERTIWELNYCMSQYKDTGGMEWWWQMIQLLPTSYNQLRTVQLNYQVLKHMYHARKLHKLDEWREFCRWCEYLPCAELITGGDKT